MNEKAADRRKVHVKPVTPEACDARDRDIVVIRPKSMPTLQASVRSKSSERSESRKRS